MTDRLRRYRDGLLAETLAAWYLRCKGYRILARRYKTGVGEIDLVAKRKDVIAFVEVKRRTDHDSAVFAVTSRAQARIVRAARVFLSRHPHLNGCVLRFDVLTVTPPLRLRHVDNAWPGEW